MGGVGVLPGAAAVFRVRHSSDRLRVFTLQGLAAARMTGLPPPYHVGTLPIMRPDATDL
jgi:hypothetical protein